MYYHPEFDLIGELSRPDEYYLIVNKIDDYVVHRFDYISMDHITRMGWIYIGDL